MEKERFLVEVTVRGEKDWKAIHMCGSMADAVPVADAVHNLSYLLDTPIAIRVREKRGARVWRTDGWKGAKITWQSILAR